MNTAQTISAQVERLPLKLQEEVLHFIKYLVFRNSIESTVPEQQIFSFFPHIMQKNISGFSLRVPRNSIESTVPEQQIFSFFPHIMQKNISGFSLRVP